MGARKRNEIHAGTGLYGDVLSSGVGGIVGVSSPVTEKKSRADALDEESAEFIREHVSRLLGDSRYCTALAALGAKSRNSHTRLPPEVAASLMDMLTFLMVFAVIKRCRRETWERFWVIETGKTWKALNEFPGRLRAMAEELGRLNVSPFFGPHRAIGSKAPIATYAKRQFLLLPTTLRRYADWMEAWTQKIPVLFKQAGPPAPRGHSRHVGYVSALAKCITGRSRDKEVVELLNAAELVLNPSDPKSGERFDVQTLLDQRSRHKRNAPRT